MVDLQVLLSRIDTTKIHPWLLAKVKEALINCGKRGAVYYVISGLRTWDEQAAIYAKGRDKDGKVVDKSKVMSNAPAGTSFHNYGLAVDVALDSDLSKVGLQPSWDKDDYKIWAEESEKVGLEAGLYWKSFIDPVHSQVSLKTLGLTSINQLRSLYLKRGEKGIKEFLDLKLS